MDVALLAAALLACVVALAVAVPRWLAERRADAVSRELPDALETVARSLRAGHGLAAGLSAVGAQRAGPTARAFQRAWAAQNAGTPLGKALQDAVRSVPSIELSLFATAVAVHEELGGNLAEVSDRIAATVRARRHLEQEVRALGAQGRLAAIVAGVMPFVMAIVLSRLSPHYLDPLAQTETGRTLVASGLLSLVVGVITLRRLARVHA